MKIAIIYATHHGTTQAVAQQMQQQLQPHRVEMIDLARNKKPDLTSYDILVLGSSIHAGNNSSAMKSFCKRNLSELLQKPVALFLSCLNKDEFEHYKENAYPQILCHHAFGFQLTGGEYKMDQMNFIERFLVKRIAGVNQSQSFINNDNIAAIVSAIHDCASALTTGSSEPSVISQPFILSLKP